MPGGGITKSLRMRVPMQLLRLSDRYTYVFSN